MPDILKKILKKILVLLLIIAASFGIELLVFNYRTFVKGEKADIFYQQGGETPENLETVEEMAHGIRLVMKEPTYIKKLKVVLNTPEKVDYTFYVRYDNSFKTEELEKTTDAYWPELGSGFSNIDKDVKVLSLAFPKGVELKSIHLYSITAMNKYRLLLLMITFFFIYVIFTKKQWFSRQLDWITAAAILILGSFTIFSQGISENGWDEQIHFKNVYQLSFVGGEIKSNDTYRLMCDRLTKDRYNTAEEKELLTQYLNDKYHSNEEMIENSVSFKPSYTGYLLQAFGVWLGRLMNLSFNRMYMLGKFLNLLLYVIGMFFAIRLMPRKKEIIAALAMVPTQVYIATTYTYDVTLNVFMMLGMVLWLKAVLEEKANAIRYLLGSVLAFGFGSLSKAVYIPMIAVCFSIPEKIFKDKKQKRLFFILVSVVLLTVLMTFVLPTLIWNATDQIGTTGDPRGGDTDVVLQLRSIMAYPLQYIRLFFKEVFREFGRYFAGTPGLAFFGRMNELSSRWNYILIPWIFGMTFLSRKEDCWVLEKKYKISLGVILFVVLGLIWSALYLSYSPVGATHISGVQPRYYYPLMLPLMLLLGNKRCVIDISQDVYGRIAVGIPVMLMLLGMYGNFFMQ